MNRSPFGRVVASIVLACSAAAFAHVSRAGDLSIGHPYATPSLPGTSTGAAYITTLDNVGSRPDRLLRLSTPVAARVEMHEMQVDAQGVMRMREIDAITIEPKAPIKMRPGMGMHLMLIGLKQPLKLGETFPLTMEFERAGKVDVSVVVQAAKPAAEHPH